MAYLRFEALKKLNDRTSVTVDLPASKVSDFFGNNVFGMEQMRANLAPAVYKKVSAAIKNHEKIDEPTADMIAAAVKTWAMAKGATHFTHWFQPMTGGTAEKRPSRARNAAAASSFSCGSTEQVT